MQSSVENACLFVSLFIEEAAGLWMPNARGPDLRPLLYGGNYDLGSSLPDTYRSAN